MRQRASACHQDLGPSGHGAGAGCRCGTCCRRRFPPAWGPCAGTGRSGCVVAQPSPLSVAGLKWRDYRRCLVSHRQGRVPRVPAPRNQYVQANVNAWCAAASDLWGQITDVGYVGSSITGHQLGTGHHGSSPGTGRTWDRRA